MTTLTTQQRAMASQTTRSRSFGGCTTCRTRHVKCDEGRPTCSTCKFFGLACRGYERNIFFDFESSANESTGRFRRPLFTETERRRMSEWLTTATPPNTTTRALSQIDEECENTTLTHHLRVSRGPFGAFRLDQCRSPPFDDPLSCIPKGSSSPQSLAVNNDRNDITWDTAPLSPYTLQLIESSFDQSEPIEFVTCPDFSQTIMTEPGCGQEMFDRMPLIEMDDFQMAPPASDCQFQSYMPAGASVSAFPSANSSLMRANRSIPQNSVLLLNHYVTTFIASLTPFRHTKTPWHVLFVPHAKSCMAALTLGEHLDHASLSAFYGTLAISAFSLGGISQSQTWLVQARAHKQIAREHIKLMLKTAYNVPKVAKYKSILMALITMVQLVVVSGSRDQVECYLLEAEKFIRLRGLNRKKSRKVRLLHHCYAFERMFHESLFIPGNDSRQRQHVRKAVEASGLTIYGQDRPYFRLIGWSNLAEEMTAIKSQEEGENDLHIERPGIFSATLYPEIYGVPESWLFLLSQVIRLGQEKDESEQQEHRDTLNLKDFFSRAKAIELCIIQLQRPSDTSDGDSGVIDRSVLNNMLKALYIALTIYFYRRVYDLSTPVLQQKVLSIRDCLYDCEHASANMVYGSAGFIWPAFIAACEAEDPEVQVSFANWFRNSSQQSGLSYFTDTLADIEQIWHEKSKSDGRNVTWLDMMKKGSLFYQRI